MKERPILFSGPMVRAILDGRKTQTRRVVKRRGRDDGQSVVISPRDGYTPESVADQFRCPYGVPGDRLWVRETWAINQCGARVSLSPDTWPDGWPSTRLRYPATDPAPNGIGLWWNLRPSIHMPRWASRLTLEITGVRVERLQEISEEDAILEGAGLARFETVVPARAAGVMWSTENHRAGFACLWDSINGKRAPWSSNPWVWVVEFAAARTEGREG